MRRARGKRPASRGFGVVAGAANLLSASLRKSGKADQWMSDRIAILKLLASTRKAATKEEL